MMIGLNVPDVTVIHTKAITTGTECMIIFFITIVY